MLGRDIDDASFSGAAVSRPQPGSTSTSTTDEPTAERTISPKTAFAMAQGAAESAAESQGETINTLRGQLETLATNALQRDKWARIEPSSQLIVDSTIVFAHPKIKEQRFVFKFSCENFINDLSRARTFCTIAMMLREASG